ncbi:alpha-glucuronidase family glycosyl hydrolase [Hufsiella ginkgonis]|uniref:Xylan alpha-1,2-glucuronidase n=1 Tax=Hufsiella ginkgonis TaxID=2695274 RepID=A0A7K1Y0F9_9SPHI|nr:alpha-glucuronidase family glycosyl hydrolase [Hufsiella ginkgonis]MXV16713.1 alpha-glucuronidase [Hufsiella ginkgonis]
MKKLLVVWIFLAGLSGSWCRAESGYDLWLRYVPVTNKSLLATYKQHTVQLVFPAGNETLNAAKQELAMGMKGLLGGPLPESAVANKDGTLIVGTPASCREITAQPLIGQLLVPAGEEGYLIRSVLVNGKKCTVIAANFNTGVLYGVFHFLRLLQTNAPIARLSISESPKVKIRTLNHWDNLDRTVERGYAGQSIWKWDELPATIDPRYRDYARANASIGVNATVLTNVNANSKILTAAYLAKVAAIANVFRAYGIKVYLTARFSSPIEIGGLKTADPLDPQVRQWWTDKVAEIYKLIPDFGGFLVKANSEGQPGPQSYGRNHADGANMLAAAVAPYHGTITWRAFVYSNEVPEDRHKQANLEFEPLDGKFNPNVLVQVKNGAIDFQPREPFHPLFGALKKTPEAMEFQLTKEYLGQGTHLVYLGTSFEETLEADTYSYGKNSQVRKIITGEITKQPLSEMAGVSNIGADSNWCGHPFSQANWYAFGRLAWNPSLSAAAIAEEWVRMTFSNDPALVKPVREMMMGSREATVNYMTPLGLHHIMAANSHYGPGPWDNALPREDWKPKYYHRADSAGIGFNRTSTGSNAVSQYFPEVRTRFENVHTTPDRFLLWFHHLPWTFKTRANKTLWNDLVDHYYLGVTQVRDMQKTWDDMEGKVDRDRFAEVKKLLVIQENEARWWRDSCLLYFQTFSGMPIPGGYEKPSYTLAEFMKRGFKP